LHTRCGHATPGLRTRFRGAAFTPCRLQVATGCGLPGRYTGCCSSTAIVPTTAITTHTFCLYRVLIHGPALPLRCARFYHRAQDTPRWFTAPTACAATLGHRTVVALYFCRTHTVYAVLRFCRAARTGTTDHWHFRSVLRCGSLYTHTARLVVSHSPFAAAAFARGSFPVRLYTGYRLVCHGTYAPLHTLTVAAPRRYICYATTRAYGCLRLLDAVCGCCACRCTALVAHTCLFGRRAAYTLPGSTGAARRGCRTLQFSRTVYAAWLVAVHTTARYAATRLVLYRFGLLHFTSSHRAAVRLRFSLNWFTLRFGSGLHTRLLPAAPACWFTPRGPVLRSRGWTRSQQRGYARSAGCRLVLGLPLALYSIPRSRCTTAPGSPRRCLTVRHTLRFWITVTCQHTAHFYLLPGSAARCVSMTCLPVLDAAGRNVGSTCRTGSALPVPAFWIFGLLLRAGLVSTRSSGLPAVAARLRLTYPATPRVCAALRAPLHLPRAPRIRAHARSLFRYCGLLRRSFLLLPTAARLVYTWVLTIRLVPFTYRFLLFYRLHYNDCAFTAFSQRFLTHILYGWTRVVSGFASWFTPPYGSGSLVCRAPHRCRTCTFGAPVYTAVHPRFRRNATFHYRCTRLAQRSAPRDLPVGYAPPRAARSYVLITPLQLPATVYARLRFNISARLPAVFGSAATLGCRSPCLAHTTNQFYHLPRIFCLVLVLRFTLVAYALFAPFSPARAQFTRVGRYRITHTCGLFLLWFARQHFTRTVYARLAHARFGTAVHCYTFAFGHATRRRFVHGFGRARLRRARYLPFCWLRIRFGSPAVADSLRTPYAHPHIHTTLYAGCHTFHCLRTHGSCRTTLCGSAHLRLPFRCTAVWFRTFADTRDLPDY